MARSVRTAFPLRPARWTPVGMDPQMGRIFEEAGTVDFVSAPDVLALSGFIPPQIERLRTSVSDNSSWYDPAVSLAVAAVAHPGLGVIHGGINAIRNGPAELFRAGLTLASLTQGRAQVWVSVGELYNVKPFGYQRSQGLARLEDHFRLYQLLWERDTPFDFEGNVWKFEGAYLGAERSHRPEFWAMGGGPRLTEIAAKYADGWVTCLPMAEPNPDAYAKRVLAVKEAVERAGRDPEAFGFAIIPNCLIHEDPDVIRATLQNPMIRLLAGLWGRTPQGRWFEEGIEPPFPDGWEYSIKWDARTMTDEQFSTAMAGISDEVVAGSFLTGSPEEVTARIHAFVDAGATLVQPVDMVGLGDRTYGDPFESDSIRWRMDIYRALKQGSWSPVAP
ncbi:LLM class flavin-dependent oxidoreductase [Cryptosporangium sp. NPDC051539]|uniref:LLM class flavin-dependent oxidoreductase n=1 Tax=Cryptosporangium sp. NPDC051539 TaxID=3363962 RepID=UPI00379A4D53